MKQAKVFNRQLIHWFKKMSILCNRPINMAPSESGHCVQTMPGLRFCCYVKIPWKKREKEFISACGVRWQSIIVWKSRWQGLKIVTWHPHSRAEMSQCIHACPQLTFSTHMVQDPNSGTSATHRGQVFHVDDDNDDVITTMTIPCRHAHRSTWPSILSLRFFFQVIIDYVNLTMNINHHKP